MKPGMVLVRATNDSGQRVVADVLDLDERSFRAFVVQTLWNAGMVVAIKPEEISEPEIPLNLMPGVPGFAVNEDEQTQDA